MTALSGGQAARAGLASLLLSRYDILLLDEPTNDLDLRGLEQLERFVAETRAALVVVSHDREFLSRTVTGIVELDLAQQDIAVYDGGYESYLAEREIARQHAREAFEEYAGTRSDLEDRAQMQRNWMEHGVRNARRKAKDNDKIGRGLRTESTEKQAAKARQTQRRIERLEVVEEPRKEWELRMEIAAAPRSGSVVATTNGAKVTRGQFTFGPVTTQIDWGDRILVTGANGAGKTTLLNVLLGKLVPDEGIASLGSGVAIGEIDQARGLFEGDQPVVEAFGAQVPDWPDADVRTLLAKFGLRGHHVLRSAASPVPRRENKGCTCFAPGSRREPTGTGRADEPSRPSGDRTARAGNGVVRGNPPSGHSRSTHAAVHPKHAPVANGERTALRGVADRLCLRRQPACATIYQAHAIVACAA